MNMLYRFNYTSGGVIREYKNGNITIKLDAETMKDPEYVKKYGGELLVNLLDSLDCYFIGEDGSAGNWDIYTTIYNYHSDKIYVLLWNRDFYGRFLKGYTIRLYARTPDKDDRETIENEGF